MRGNEYPDSRAKPSVPQDAPVDAFDAAIPNPPAHIDRVAKKFFKRVAEALSIAGVLRNTDWMLLGELAQAASDVARLTLEVRNEKEMLEHPDTKAKYWNPKNGLLKEARKRLRDLSDRFGINPKARSALRFPTGDVSAPGAPEAEDDQMELLIEDDKKFVHAQAWRQAGSSAVVPPATDGKTAG